MNQIVTITDSAKEKIISTMEFPGDNLRIAVKGGGCSGFTYTLDFDHMKRKFDLQFESNGVTILVDKKSNLYIGKTTIDWSYNLMDRGLKFNNPDAKGSCGCKTSFMIDIPHINTTPSWM